MLDVRPSPIVGQWYEGNAKALALNIDRFLDNATPPESDGDVMAVIAPHAGHIYSGEVAGCAFAVLREKQPDLVVVVAPMHHPYYEPLLTSAHDAYRTPLGDVLVDKGALAELNLALQSELGFGLVAISKDPEHSLCAASAGSSPPLTKPAGSVHLPRKGSLTRLTNNTLSARVTNTAAATFGSTKWIHPHFEQTGRKLPNRS